MPVELGTKKPRLSAELDGAFIRSAIEDCHNLRKGASLREGAAMIAESTVRKVIDETDLVAFVGQHVELKKLGVDHKGPCPFHNEKSPSFTVSPSRGTCHCYGCGWHGDAARFVMDFLRVDFPTAIKHLAAPHGIHIDENARPRKLNRTYDEYSDPDPAPRSEDWKLPSSRKKARGDDGEPFDWEPCMGAFTPEHAGRMAGDRG